MIKNKFLLLLLCLSLTLSLAPPNTPVHAQTGDGSTGNPFVITSCQELQDMNLNLGAHYILGGNIDCSDTVNWNSGAGFEPIGSYDTRFEGSFDGKGFTISNLYINRPLEDYVGLFSYVHKNVDTNEVMNVTLSGVNITGQNNTGGFAGKTYANTGLQLLITDVNVSGTVSGVGYVGGVFGEPSLTYIRSNSFNGNVNGSGIYVGGLAGRAGSSVTISTAFTKGTVTNTGEHTGGLVGTLSGTIRKSYSESNVNGKKYSGGLAGSMSGAISESYSKGKTYVPITETSNYYVGGISGVAYAGASLLNSYSWGDVTASRRVGGLVGYINADVTIENSYSNSKITFNSAYTDVGGLAGYNAGTITSSYWNTEISGLSSSFGGSGKTDLEMKTQSTFVGWDFTNLWAIKNGYPYLKNNLPIDTTAPAQVSNLQETHTNTSTTLTFGKPADVDFSHVKIYRNGILIANNVTTTSYNVTGLTASTSYQFKVVTVDKSGNDNLGRTLYMSTNYEPKHYSNGTFDNEPWSIDGTLNVNNSANFNDNNDATFSALKGTATDSGSYIALALNKGHDIDRIFVEYSSENKPDIILYDSSYQTLTHVVPENGLNTFPVVSGVQYIEIYGQSGTRTTKLYELELFQPNTDASSEFAKGHLSYEIWTSDGELGITNSSYMHDDDNSTYGRMIGTTTADSSNYYVYNFSKPQIINSVFVNYNSIDNPRVVFYDSNYGFLYEKTLSSNGDILPQISGVKYIELYGIKNQQPMDIYEVEFYGPNTTPPDEISNLSSSKTTTTVTLNWQKPSNGDFSGVKIYRDNVLIASNITDNYFVDTSLSSGTEFNYKIISVDIDGNESAGVAISVVTDSSSIPTDVENLQENHTDSTVNLSWTNPVDGNYSFIRIYRNGMMVADNLTGTTYIDSELSRGKSYSYKVVTVNAAGDFESPGKNITATTDGILSLTLPDVNDFGNVLLNDTTNIVTTEFSGNIQVEDTTNSASGWNVTVQATQFTQIGGKGLTFPIGSLRLKEPSNINPLAGTSSPNPSISSSGPWIIDGGSALKILSANINEGMGVYDIVFPNDALELTIPMDLELNDFSNFPTGTTYESTLSFSIVAGP